MGKFSAAAKHLKIVGETALPRAPDEAFRRQHEVAIWHILETLRSWDKKPADIGAPAGASRYPDVAPGNIEAERDFEAFIGALQYGMRAQSIYSFQARQAMRNGIAIASNLANPAECLEKLQARAAMIPTSVPAALSFVLSEFLRPPEGLAINLGEVEGINGIFSQQRTISERYTSVRDRVKNTLRINTINRYPVRPWIRSMDDIFAPDSDKEARNKANYVTMVVNEVVHKDSLIDQIFRAYSDLESICDVTNPLFHSDARVRNQLYHAVTVYAPLAGKMGLEKLQENILEEVVRIADPERYRFIKKYYKGFDYGGDFSRAVERKLCSVMDANPRYKGIYRIEGGTKSVWSTYVKMRGKLPRAIACKEKELRKLEDAIAEKKNSAKPYSAETARKDQEKLRAMGGCLQRLREDNERFGDAFGADYFDKYLHDKKRKRIIFDSAAYLERFGNERGETRLELEMRKCLELMDLFNGRLTAVPGQAAFYLGKTAKDNGYKAAHNVYHVEGIAAPKGTMFDPRLAFELQIVGTQMHAMNTCGDATHDAYKYGSKVAGALHRAFKETTAEVAKKDVVVVTPGGDYLRLKTDRPDRAPTVTDAAVKISPGLAAAMESSGHSIVRNNAGGMSEISEANRGDALQNGDLVTIARREMSGPHTRHEKDPHVIATNLVQDNDFQNNELIEIYGHITGHDRRRSFRAPFRARGIFSELNK